MEQTYHWDRDGNTHWQSCPACERYFPVSAALHAADTIDMVCPACHHSFRPSAPDAEGQSRQESGEQK